MGIFDIAKSRAKEAAALTAAAATKAAEAAKIAATGAAQKVDQGGYVDKVASTIDAKTGGKYADKISKASASASSAVTKLAADADKVTEHHDSGTNHSGPATLDEALVEFTSEGAPPPPPRTPWKPGMPPVEENPGAPAALKAEEEIDLPEAPSNLDGFEPKPDQPQ